MGKTCVPLDLQRLLVGEEPYRVGVRGVHRQAKQCLSIIIRGLILLKCLTFTAEM